ncbi:MAG: chromosomal replication initiator protein DnaA [Lachnospiraceae bacterium]|nr:chromosomal replication initiator protein DnaA [Lachnospiraceae bacterium]
MFQTIQSKWDDIKSFLKEEHGLLDVSYDTWINPLVPGAMIGDKLYIIFSNDEHTGMIDYVVKKYRTFLQISIEAVTGIHIDENNIEIVSNLPDQSESEPVIRRPVVNTYDSDTPVTRSANLNPRYTFDTFVVGPNNKFAHAAALSVAESPANIYNPLYLYGGVGLGKTHLMHSIAHFILKNDPSKKIIYISSESFMNEMIDSIKNKSQNAFRNKYRNMDVLLIDDIQFLADKEGTQEEFFHTFNALYDAKKQIVISSDKPPKALTTLEDRLRSRFESGLTADISSPDFETRMAILRKKEEQEGYNIDNEVLKYIALNIKTNIRELEGALTKIIAYSKLSNIKINVEAAEEALKDLISPDEVKEITIDYIVKVVAEHFSIKEDDLRSTNKKKEISYPRQIAMYLCKNMTDSTLNAIGASLGGKDHTTVMYGCDKIKKDMENSETLRSTIDILSKKINPN